VIPDFNMSGVLPPFWGGSATASDKMSPYSASMSDLVEKFATSRERIEILTGLLAYRRQLLSAGIITGFQWIDGSFVEDTERTRGRAPADVDLVTFARRPPALSDTTTWRQFCLDNPKLFETGNCKAEFKCDAYYVDLGKDPEMIVDETRYWFGLFSHQRVSALWKGMISIPLNSDDSHASTLIARGVSC
jgi:hypothetical protein